MDNSIKEIRLEITDRINKLRDLKEKAFVEEIKLSVAETKYFAMINGKIALHKILLDKTIAIKGYFKDNKTMILSYFVNSDEGKFNDSLRIAYDTKKETVVFIEQEYLASADRLQVVKREYTKEENKILDKLLNILKGNA